MSVLIQGMEMPKNCFMCPFSEIYDADNDQCSITGELYDSTPFKPEFRRSDCPLIKIPPHGRLIDADELETDTEYDMYLDDYIGYSKEQIRSAPTIIPADKED